MVTHHTTNWPACGLSTAERTGSPVLHTLWSYVLVVDLRHIICYNKMNLLLIPASAHQMKTSRTGCKRPLYTARLLCIGISCSCVFNRPSTSSDLLEKDENISACVQTLMVQTQYLDDTGHSRRGPRQATGCISPGMSV